MENLIWDEILYRESNITYFPDSLHAVNPQMLIKIFLWKAMHLRHWASNQLILVIMFFKSDCIQYNTTVLPNISARSFLVPVFYYPLTNLVVPSAWQKGGFRLKTKIKFLNFSYEQRLDFFFNIKEEDLQEFHLTWKKRFWPLNFFKRPNFGP